MSELKGTFFIVSYEDSFGNTDIEGVYTMKSFKVYLKERNVDRKAEGESIETIDEFEFEPVEVNI